MNTIFLLLALAGVAVGVVSSIAVTAYVSRRGVKVNYLLWRIMIFKYFNDYSHLTAQETGRTGPWVYIFIAGMGLALAFVIIGIIAR